MKYILLFLNSLITLNFSIVAQLIVPNGDFELFNQTKANREISINNLLYWNITPVDRNTPDYVNIKENAKVITDLYGKQDPKSGNGYVGLRIYPYAECIKTPLNKTLEKDKEYIISMYVSFAEASLYAISKFPIFLYDSSFSAAGYELVEPIILEKENKKSIIDTEKWVKLSVKYTAKGNENYINIGHYTTVFYEQQLDKQKRKKSSYSIKESYYYIDLIEIKEVSG